LTAFWVVNCALARVPLAGCNAEIAQSRLAAKGAFVSVGVHFTPRVSDRRQR